MFHMKHLLPDTELPEHCVENILDIDTTGEAAECVARSAQLFGADLRLRALGPSGVERLGTAAKRRSMPGPDNDVRFPRLELVRNKTAERVGQRIEAKA